MMDENVYIIIIVLLLLLIYRAYT